MNTTDLQPFTPEEVRAAFLDKVWESIETFAKDEARTPTERITASVFSVLAILDGADVSLPGFFVLPAPHEEDEPFRRARGERWYMDGEKVGVESDIAGSLHDEFYDRPAAKRVLGIE